ncbi:MAG: carbamoyl-phosphate synthase large subunit, partial [Candidatus Obscuribacterales bacterium]|nr:carbamoyl-phosphate synthase large subunit [Candidatus Obscuribacterales bacterium]
TMAKIGVPVPLSYILHSMEELAAIEAELTLPMVIRPAFTLGGTGGGIARTVDELRYICKTGIDASPVSEILLETYLQGWKEVELEVVRDCNDNFIVVCPIENFDPMGVHTGDSITVAPLQTIADKEYQRLREASKLIIRAIGVDCGGSNIQFAVNPVNGDFVVIEMNPRVSRSSALASKATGYPIARVAAKLAIGLTLDEVRNEIAGDISACFEPSIDYVVTKIPRFDFGKFAGASQALGTEMKSVGEVMAIGATFQESMQKALRGLELGLSGFSAQSGRDSDNAEIWKQRMSHPSRHRLSDTWGAFNAGFTPQDLNEISGIDIWFLDNLYEIWQTAKNALHVWTERATFAQKSLQKLIKLEELQELKRMGFGDKQLAEIISQVPSFGWVRETDLFFLRHSLGILPSFNVIDTCAAEFPSSGNYLYSTYNFQSESEYDPQGGRKIMVLGAGPNRIGQGIEFDYCCVQGVLELREMGLRTVMMNCNPETVSTDYDTSDVLYFESLTLEDVTEAAFNENVEGIVLQFGGQTPLKLAHGLEQRGFKILGTSPDSTDIAEDRQRFGKLVDKLGLKQAQGATALSANQARAIAKEIGFPLLVRPSYVLGGRQMHVVHSMEVLESLLDSAFSVAPEKPILLDKFLTSALEIDVDLVCDGTDVVIAGVMEHVEHAGVHSGDSSCVLPPQSVSKELLSQIKSAAVSLAKELKIVGCLNIQLAVHENEIYVLEANPRASRTLPFVCKATGVAWARVAVRVIMGETLKSLEHLWQHSSSHVSVKSVVIPFSRFHGSSVSLGPEMRSTGEVMGIGKNFEAAYAKAQTGAGTVIPSSGTVLVSASEKCMPAASAILGMYKSLGFETILSHWNENSSVDDFGGSDLFDAHPLTEHEVCKQMQELGVKLSISVGKLGETSVTDQKIRRASISTRVPLVLTAESAIALAKSIPGYTTLPETVVNIQSLHPALL